MGGVLLARYDDGSTLRYSELLGVGGLTASRRGAGFWIPLAWVDDHGSLAGGRAIWDIPKQMADFSWDESPARTDVTVSGEQGPILGVSARGSRPAMPLPILAPFLGRGARALGIVRGGLRGAPARIAVDLPDGSPLGALGLSFSCVGLVGRARLHVHALAAHSPSVRPASYRLTG